jgi:hypothetical protein
MENEFVTYDIAKNLKKLNFNEKCFGWFRKQGNISFFNPKKLNGNNIDIQRFDEYVKAPLWQQVLDWLRTKHHCWVKENACSCVV